MSTDFSAPNAAPIKHSAEWKGKGYAVLKIAQLRKTSAAEVTTNRTAIRESCENGTVQ